MSPSVLPDLTIVDESLNENRALSCKLIGQISGESLDLAVLDTQESRYLAVQRYRFLSHFNAEDFCTWLQDITAADILSWHFSSVRMLVANQEYTLVPGPLFSPPQKEEYLRFNLSILQGDYTFFTDRLTGLDAVTIFAVPSWLKTKLDELFTPVSVHHTVSAFIESILNHYKYLTGDHVSFVNIQPGFFDLLLLHDHRVIFCNSFSYKTPDDLLYYVMFVLEQLQLTPDQMEVNVMGEIGKHAPVIEKLHAYFPHLDFVTRNESYRYSHRFEEIPGHFFYNLLSAEQCEL